MLFQKVLKSALTIGLIIALLVAILRKKSRMGLKARGFILLTKYRALLPYIIAQAKHETGNYKSRLYLDSNNLFGMKMPERRPTIATKGFLSPEGNNYAQYKSDFESLQDLLLWMDFVKFPVRVQSPDEYAKSLKAKSYFGDTVENYTNGLKRFLS